MASKKQKQQKKGIFFARKAQQVLAGGLSHSQELEVSLHSGLYLLVFNKRGIDRSVKAGLLLIKVEMLRLMEVEDWKEQSLRVVIIMLSYSICTSVSSIIV